MSEPLVSVRLPSSLVKELRGISEKDHYLDLSECVRSIIRTKSMQAADPYTSELREVKEEIKNRLSEKAALVKQEAKKEKVTKDLRKVLEQLEELP
jgi:Arc/MetJ-type ribon-helix-helix transcriptional regulator